MELGSPTHPDEKDTGPLTFVDPLGDVLGECQVVSKGGGARTGDRVLLDCAKNCTKEARQCGKVQEVCKQQVNPIIFILKFFLVCNSCV